MPDTPLPAPPRADAKRRIGVADADRERIATILSNAFAEDVISLDEFEQRVARVYRATTRVELESLVADLRAAPGVHTPATAIATADDVPGHDRRFAVLASLTHHSIAIMPRRLDVSAVLGNVELDLRDAKFGVGESELHLRAVLGNITVTLPAGAVVEQRASSVLGSIECQPSPPRTGRSRAPVVRLTGHAVLGAVEIRFAAPGALAGDLRGSAPRLDKPRRVP
jgi:hypothetical protein